MFYFCLSRGEMREPRCLWTQSSTQQFGFSACRANHPADVQRDKVSFAKQKKQCGGEIYEEFS